MKTLITTLAIAAICGVQIFCAAAQPGVAGAPANAILAVSSAPSPSAAVEAYARALPMQADNSSLTQAYVKRMVDFGMPEMATAQAAALNQNDPAFGLAWAVSALAASHQQDAAMAMTDIATAHRLLGDDPFVRRTAGQLVAWYDAIRDKSQIPLAVQQDVADLKTSLASDPVYADAYAQTKSYYAQAPATASAAALGAQTAVTPPEAAAAPDDGAMPSGDYIDAYVAPAAPPPVAYDYYAQPYVATPDYGQAYYPGYYNTGAYFYAAPVVVTPGFGGFAHFGPTRSFQGGGFHGGFAHGGGAAPHFSGGGSFHGGGGHRR